MLRYTCVGCQDGHHDLCAGRQSPPPGMMGGSECICDGNCGSQKAKPAPQLSGLAAPMEAYLAALTEPSAERRLADLLSSCKQFRDHAQRANGMLRVEPEQAERALFEAIDKAESKS